MRYYRISFSNKTSPLTGTNNKWTELQNKTAYLFTPVRTPAVLNNPERKLFLKQRVHWKKNISKETTRTVNLMFVKSYLFPPKSTPAILNNPVGKNPMPNGCFCKNRTTSVQTLCLVPSTAICTFMSEMPQLKKWSQKVWNQTPVVILLIHPVCSYSSSNTSLSKT